MGKWFPSLLLLRAYVTYIIYRSSKLNMYWITLYFTSHNSRKEYFYSPRENCISIHTGWRSRIDCFPSQVGGYPVSTWRRRRRRLRRTDISETHNTCAYLSSTFISRVKWWCKSYVSVCFVENNIYVLIFTAKSFYRKSNTALMLLSCDIYEIT